MKVYVIVVRSTNEFVDVYASMDSIPNVIMDNDEYYMIITQELRGFVSL